MAVNAKIGIHGGFSTRDLGNVYEVLDFFDELRDFYENMEYAVGFKRGKKRDLKLIDRLYMKYVLEEDLAHTTSLVHRFVLEKLKESGEFDKSVEIGLEIVDSFHEAVYFIMSEGEYLKPVRMLVSTPLICSTLFLDVPLEKLEKRKEPLWLYPEEFM